MSHRFDFSGERRSTHGTPDAPQGDLQGAPDKVQHAGGEDDEDPGVEDGVHRDEAEGPQVQRMGLVPTVSRYGVDVHPDLWNQRRKTQGGYRSEPGVKASRDLTAKQTDLLTDVRVINSTFDTSRPNRRPTGAGSSWF